MSIYQSAAAFPVYCYDCWWSDQWDALSYGSEYQPGRSFFEQLAPLFARVPRLGIVTASCENADYANYTNYSRNCYLIFGCHEAQDSYYSWRVHHGLQCVDCLQMDQSQYCYECIDCDECYELLFSQDCSCCSNSAFLFDCKNCQSCLFCSGLRNARYCLNNKQCSKEDYEHALGDLSLSSARAVAQAKERFAGFIGGQPRRSLFVLNCENVTGDHLINAKNVRQGFHLKNIHDGAYLESCEDLKDALDSTFCGWPAELNYEGISAGCVNAYNTKFSSTSWSCSDIEYCESCHHSSDLFGCLGLRQQNKYCILNRQYDKAAYLSLRRTIIEDMLRAGEYGEFFPVHLSPFAYNETIANEYFPLDKSQALAQGFRWRDEDPRDHRPATIELPDDLSAVPPEITREVLVCGKCGRNYRIIQQELEFYRKMGVALPRSCFDCRHTLRMMQRAPRQIWSRPCSRCGKEIMSTCAPSRPEIVYCEECYLETIY